jgi:hypothetical protein
VAPSFGHRKGFEDDSRIALFVRGHEVRDSSFGSLLYYHH